MSSKLPKKENDAVDRGQVREEIRNAMDVAGNMSQYLKYVNDHFQRQQTHVKKMIDENSLF